MTRSARQSDHRRRGTVLIVLMVLLLVTTSLAIAVMQAAMVDARQFATDANALQADRLAEAGIARAAALKASNPDFKGDEWTVELPGGKSGTVTVQLKEAAGGLTFESVATYPASGPRLVRSRRTLALAQSTP
jgi:Tfp pilus assembly protein PilX